MSYSVRHAGNFDLEKRSHSDISPFKCDVCKLSFKHKISLIQHKGSKKHLAKIKFLIDRDQEKDKISHSPKPSNAETKDINGNAGSSKDNPFKCDICSFQTKWKISLEVHLKSKKHKIAQSKSKVSRINF